MIPLIIATGSNQGDSLLYLAQALNLLCAEYEFVAKSKVYHSRPVGYLDQPNFYNQVLEFRCSDNLTPDEVMKKLLEIESVMGRKRDIFQGPRTIDIDLLFWSTQTYASSIVEIPHPRLFERSFVVLPLKELPYFSTLSQHFTFPSSFSNTASPLDDAR